MNLTPAFFEQVQRQGGSLHAQVLSRDGLHLAPARLSQAAARRLRTGLRALETYLRRLLILLALSLEPGLKPDLRARPIYARQRISPAQSPSFRIFQGEAACPDHWPDPVWMAKPSEPVPTAPLLARLAALKTLLDAPEARARRLAWSLARRRPGPLMPPGAGQIGVPRRYGTQPSAIYHAMAQAIFTAGRARPPPLGPAPRTPPRIRRL